MEKKIMMLIKHAQEVVADPKKVMEVSQDIYLAEGYRTKDGLWTARVRVVKAMNYLLKVWELKYQLSEEQFEAVQGEAVSYLNDRLVVLTRIEM